MSQRQAAARNNAVREIMALKEKQALAAAEAAAKEAAKKRGGGAAGGRNGETAAAVVGKGGKVVTGTGAPPGSNVGVAGNPTGDVLRVLETALAKAVAEGGTTGKPEVAALPMDASWAFADPSKAEEIKNRPKAEPVGSRRGSSGTTATATASFKGVVMSEIDESEVAEKMRLMQEQMEKLRSYPRSAKEGDGTQKESIWSNIFSCLPADAPVVASSAANPPSPTRNPFCLLSKDRTSPTRRNGWLSKGKGEEGPEAARDETLRRTLFGNWKKPDATSTDGGSGKGVVVSPAMAPPPLANGASSLGLGLIASDWQQPSANGIAKRRMGSESSEGSGAATVGSGSVSECGFGNIGGEGNGKPSVPVFTFSASPTKAMQTSEPLSPTKLINFAMPAPMTGSVTYAGIHLGEGATLGPEILAVNSPPVQFREIDRPINYNLGPERLVGMPELLTDDELEAALQSETDRLKTENDMLRTENDKLKRIRDDAAEAQQAPQPKPHAVPVPKIPPPQPQPAGKKKKGKNQSPPVQTSVRPHDNKKKSAMPPPAPIVKTNTRPPGADASAAARGGAAAAPSGPLPAPPPSPTTEACTATTESPELRQRPPLSDASRKLLAALDAIVGPPCVGGKGDDAKYGE
ncbi:hypothetical protein HK101_005580, partial [Irineochytrium annulatum]